jgi:hypothetical protein
VAKIWLMAVPDNGEMVRLETDDRPLKNRGHEVFQQ